MRLQGTLSIFILGVLAACAAPHSSADTYTSSSGATTLIESNREQCERSCNDTYTRCMETYEAVNPAVNAPQGMFGASADCRGALQDCLPSCRGR